MACFAPACDDLTDIELLVGRVVGRGGDVDSSNCVSFKKSAEDGVGVFAARALEQGAVLMRIPYAECITADAITSCEALKCIFDEQPGLLDYPDEVLCIGLMHAALPCGAQCGWADHVRTMPRASELNSTLYWSPEELEELNGCMVYHLTGMLQRQIETDWTSIHSALAAAYPRLLGGATHALYKWAISMVYSRAVGLHRNNVYTRVIAPVLDLANHNPCVGAETADTFHYNSATGNLEFISARAVQAGEQVFAVYGPYPNAKLAYTYGFVIHAQEPQAVDLWTRVLPSTSNAEAKTALLQAQPLTAAQTYDFSGTLRPNFISGALLSTVRVMQSTAEELRGLLDGTVPYIGNIVSTRNEASTYASLREILLARLNVSKFQQDRERLGKLLLDGVPQTNRTVMALVIQVEERELCKHCMGLVGKFQAALERDGEAYVPPDTRSGRTPSVLC